MAKIFVKEAAKKTSDFFLSESTGYIYQRTTNGGFFCFNLGMIVAVRGGLQSIPVGSIITIEVDK